MNAILRKIEPNLFELEYPISTINGLTTCIKRKVQVVQGFWLVFGILESKTLVHSVFHNYRAFKVEFEKQMKVEIKRLK